MPAGQFAVLKTILTCVRKNAIRCAMDIIDYQGVLSDEPDYLSVATDKTSSVLFFPAMTPDELMTAIPAVP